MLSKLLIGSKNFSIFRMNINKLMLQSADNKPPYHASAYSLNVSAPDGEKRIYLAKKTNHTILFALNVFFWAGSVGWTPKVSMDFCNDWKKLFFALEFKQNLISTTETVICLDLMLKSGVSEFSVWSSKMSQRFCERMVVWKSMEHSTITMMTFKLIEKC